MLKFTLEHRLNCTPERHWELFFDPEWNRTLIVGGLGFFSCECSPAVDDGEQRRRTMRVTPKLNVPAAVAKLLGPRLAYTEKGVFHIPTERFEYETILSVLADKIRLGGAVSIRDEGDGKCTRIAELWTEAKIFAIGSMVERAAERNLRDGWGDSARWINGWLSEHPA